jgi:hypothetical protein
MVGLVGSEGALVVLADRGKPHPVYAGRIAVGIIELPDLRRIEGADLFAPASSPTSWLGFAARGFSVCGDVAARGSDRVLCAIRQHGADQRDEVH